MARCSVQITFQITFRITLLLSIGLAGCATPIEIPNADGGMAPANDGFGGRTPDSSVAIDDFEGQTGPDNDWKNGLDGDGDADPAIADDAAVDAAADLDDATADLDDAAADLGADSVVDAQPDGSTDSGVDALPIDAVIDVTPD